MGDVPLNLNVPFRPITWPQDTLSVPNGQGRMPAVDFTNQAIKREYFTYSGSILGTMPNNTYSLQIPIQKDGDFWCSSITGISAFLNPGFGIYMQQNADARITVTDSVAAYSMFTPYIPFDMISRNAVSSAINSIFASYFVTNIIEPYCFVRGGNINIQVTTLPNQINAGLDLWFAFNGWKEYANASS